MALTPRSLRLRRAKRQGQVSRATVGLAILAGGTTLGVAVHEFSRIWRRGHAPMPAETEDLVGAVETAARETAEVAVAGYREASARETAVLNLLGSFVTTWALVRTSTHMIRRRGALGPVRNVSLGNTHIHHFVPGIVLLLVAGCASVISDNEEHDRWLAIPFGVGAALTLDESALLLELDDVYWTERGVVSVQATLGATAILGTVALAMRLLRRGEREVLPPQNLTVSSWPMEEEVPA
jgi:hypothetical protein